MRSKANEKTIGRNTWYTVYETAQINLFGRIFYFNFEFKVFCRFTKYDFA